MSAVRVGCVSLQFVPSYLRAVSKDIKKSEKKTMWEAVMGGVKRGGLLSRGPARARRSGGSRS